MAVVKTDQPDPAERLAVALEKLSRDVAELVTIARRFERSSGLPPRRRPDGPSPLPLRR